MIGKRCKQVSEKCRASERERERRQKKEIEQEPERGSETGRSYRERRFNTSERETEKGDRARTREGARGRQELPRKTLKP